MRSQGGSQVHAGHRIRLSVGPADVRLLFGSLTHYQRSGDIPLFSTIITLVLSECYNRVMIGLQRGAYLP